MSTFAKGNPFSLFSGTPFFGTYFFLFFLSPAKVGSLEMQPGAKLQAYLGVSIGQMLDGRVLGASQVEYKPFGKPPLQREKGSQKKGSPKKREKWFPLAKLDIAGRHGVRGLFAAILSRRKQLDLPHLLCLTSQI